MKRIISIIIFLAIALSAWSQSMSMSQKHMERIQRMPVSIIHKVMQDSEGYMWYATYRGGLCRDNGYQIDMFRSDRNTPDLIADNDVLSMLEISDNRILFGTRRGAYCLDKHDYSIHPLDSMFQGNIAVPAIMADRQGVIWIAYDQHISSFTQNGEIIHTYDILHLNNPIDVANIFIDSHDNVWVMQKNGGMGIISGGRYSEQMWFWNSPICMAEMTDGVLLIGTDGSGVINYFENMGFPVEYIDEQYVNDMLFDHKHGILWLTSRTGLHAYDNTGNPVILSGGKPDESSVSTENLLLEGLCFDRQGNLWVSGYTPHSFVLTFPNGNIQRDHIDAFKAVVGDHSKIEKIHFEEPAFFWIFERQTGLSLYNTITHSLQQVGYLATNEVIATCRDDGVWTTDGYRVYRIGIQQDGSLYSQTLIGDSLDSQVRYLREKDGCLYIATDSALYAFSLIHGGLSEIKASGHRLPHVDFITKISDSLCICVSSSDGTYLIKDDKSYQLKDYYRDTEPIIDSKRRVIWMADRNGSVYCLETNDLSQPIDNSEIFTEESEACNKDGDPIRQLLLDSGGHLWILSDKYISEYNPDTHAKRIIYSHDSDIGMGNFQWCCETGDGVSIGGSGGLCYIKHTNALDTHHTTVRPKVSSYTANGRRLFVGVDDREIHISSGITNMVIYLTTNDATLSDCITFAYRIKGVNDSWIYLPQGVNALSLINLQKGTYTLQVKATDGSSCWNEPIDCITIIRHPAWWESWWAITLYYILALAMLLLAMLYYRLMQRRRQRFDRLVALLHDQQQQLDEQRQADKDIVPDGQHVTSADTNQENSADTELTDYDRQFLEKAIDSIERNISNETYGVDQFSSDMCMSRVNLYRRLLSITGQTPSDFIKSYRLNRAAQLIVSDQYSITAISEMTGFSSPSYFRKCFKDKFGVLPSNYKG